MEDRIRKRVLEYYDSELDNQFAKASYNLTDEEIKMLHDTLGFAVWNLSYELENATDEIKKYAVDYINLFLKLIWKNGKQ